MQKWSWIIWVFLGFSSLLSARSESGLQDAFSAYRPIYFIVGTGDDVKTRIMEENASLGKELETNQMVKLSYSMKYQFFHKYKTGIYLGFTQVMFWDIFNESSPLSEINYNPDLFFRFESENNFIQDLDTGLLEYLQLGIEHKSNGLAGSESRAYDRAYGQIELALGDKNRISLNAKYFQFFQEFLPDWYISEVDDIAQYRSSWEFKTQMELDMGWAFFLPHIITLEAGPGGGSNQFDFTQGYQQLDVVFGDVFGGMHPFVQVWNGYGEGLIGYNQSNLSLRIGIMLR